MAKGNYIKLADYVFCSGLVLSFIIPFIFYISLNKTVYVEPKTPNSNNQDIISNLEQCEFKNGVLRLRGWITPKEGAGNIMLFADVDGKTLKLHTGQINRPDVSTYMNRPGIYDKSGFAASLYIGEDTKSITSIIQVIKNEKIYVVNHECK